MSGGKSPADACRLPQLLCGAVVLGLSVTLAKQQVHGSPPTPTSFGSFAGAFGIIAAAVGIVGLVVEAVPVLVVLVVDALAAIFYLAGGIVSPRRWCHFPQ